jgi:hypothetical protein
VYSEKPNLNRVGKLIKEIMASTDLKTYLNYMSTWDTESDDNIDSIIKEQTLFVQVGDFDSDPAVESEFDELKSLAMEVRDLTIAQDALKIAADAAAVASIWSFGLGMAAFAALEAAEIIDGKFISDKSNKLNNKLTTVDIDISKKINPNVDAYVAQYKLNNNLIASKAPAGLDTKTCRADLLQFMAQVQRRAGKLDAVTFRKYAESARIVYDSTVINQVYDALDELNLSGKTDADVQKFMNTLVGWAAPVAATVGTELVRGVSILILKNRLNIATKTIETAARDAGLPVEEVGVSVFEAMDAVGKFAAAVVVIVSVVDIVFNILDIVNVVEQCDKMCTALDGKIQTNYKSYFNGIRSASKSYKAAITPSSFAEGFDAIATLPNGKTYVTKGNQYIRYSDSNATKIDEGYPMPLQANWGDLPSSFEEGFDAIATLPNGKTYVTKGNQYIRYSDSNATKIDEGYPMPLQGYWGDLPSSFAEGFDAIATLPNGKTYVTKGSQYIRYSDSNATKIDEGYPNHLKGNWGGEE